MENVGKLLQYGYVKDFNQVFCSFGTKYSCEALSFLFKDVKKEKRSMKESLRHEMKSIYSSE